MLDLGTLRIGFKADSDGAESKLKSFQKQVADTEATTKDSAQKIESATKSVNDAFGGLATGVKVGAAVAGSAFVAMAKSSLDGYASFEQNIGGINKLFGTAGQTIEEYAASVGKSTDEVKSQYDSLSRGAMQVRRDADEAWRTVGISANEYMEQVTSFSASLISSLGGDTEKAASYAKTAMTDMADNANTFGTSIGDIQHAYQGFAKQNYTMLDNLKLGYGGTKEEMQRLISDANKVKEANGEMADLSIDSFSDVVEAIHIMQDEMGIAGTTQKEALTTIEGSVNAAKAAWSNWVTELGKDESNMEDVTEALIESIVAVASNVLPRLMMIFDGIVAEIPNLFSRIVALLPAQIQTVIGVIQSILPAVAGIVAGIVSVVEGIKIADKIQTLVKGFQGLWTVLSANPILAVVALIATLAAAFATAYATNEDFRNGVNEVWGQIQPIIQGAIDGIVAAFTTFSETSQIYLMPFLQAVGDALTNLGSVLLPILQAAFVMIVPIIQEVASAFLDFATNVVAIVLPVLTQLVEAFNQFITFIAPIVTAAIAAIQTAFTTAFPYIQGVVQSVFAIILTVISTTMGVIQGIITVVTSAISGNWSGVWEGIKQIASSIWSGIQGIVSNGINLVRNVISGVLSAISSLWSSIWNGIVSFLSGVMSRMEQAVRNGINNVVNFFRNLPGSILGALGNLGGLLVNAGHQIIDGFLSGLKSAFGKVQDFVGGIGDWIAAHKGPKAYDLALLIPNGSWIMQSLATGLEKSIPLIKSVLDDTASTIAGYDFGTATVDADFNAYRRVKGSKAEKDSAASNRAQTNITVNNYSPKTLNEKDSAREFKRSVRQLALA